MHKKLQGIAAASIGLALVGAILTLFVHTPSDTSANTFHPVFFITTAMVVTHFGGALLFVLGLRGFSKESRHAYGWLVAGFVALALGFTQLPLLSLFHWDTSAWSRYGLIALPFMASVVCIYNGARLFAHLFGVKNVLTSVPLATCLALAISGLSVFLPNVTPNIQVPEATIEISKFAVMLPAVFNVWAAILAYQARKRAGALYIPATAWLTTYLILDGVSSMAGVVARLLQPGENFAFNAGYMYVPYVVAGAILIRAGLVFNRISSGRNATVDPDDVTFFGKPREAVVAAGQGTLPDILIYAAGLASNRQAVEPILDELRLVTASHSGGDSFSTSEQQRLASAYLQLETYLADQEAVRPIASNELRTSVHTQYATILAKNPTFAGSLAGDTPSPQPS